MTVNCQIHHNDLPDALALGDALAIDCAYMGDNPQRDRLYLIKIYDGNADGLVHIVHFSNDCDYAAPHLKKLLADASKEKVLYFARDDMRWIGQWLGIILGHVYCLKIASRVARTYTQSHGLDDIVRQVLGIKLPKDQHQARELSGTLSGEQLKYACNDVLYLLAARVQLDGMLEREGRKHIVSGLNACLPALVRADLAGWMNEDLFSAHISKPV